MTNQRRDQLRAECAQRLLSTRFSFYDLAVRTDLIHSVSSLTLPRANTRSMEILLHNFDRFVEEASGKKRNALERHPVTTEILTACYDAWIAKSKEYPSLLAYCREMGLAPTRAWNPKYFKDRTTIEWYMRCEKPSIKPTLTFSGKTYDLTQPDMIGTVKHRLIDNIINEAYDQDRMRACDRAIVLDHCVWVPGNSLRGDKRYKTSTTIGHLISVYSWLGGTVTIRVK